MWAKTEMKILFLWKLKILICWFILLYHCLGVTGVKHVHNEYILADGEKNDTSDLKRKLTALATRLLIGKIVTELYSKNTSFDKNCGCKALTFWITRQPYIWRLSVNTFPRSLLASSLLCDGIPCSKNYKDINIIKHVYANRMQWESFCILR